MSDTLDLAAIKARAEAATKGKWGVGNGDTIATDVEQTSRGSFRFGQIIASLDYLNYAEALDSDDPDVLAEQIEADAEHIAGMDPPTTLALVAAVEQLQAAVEGVLPLSIAVPFIQQRVRREAAAEVGRLTAERDALRAAVERVRCAVESMRFDIDEHARNYGVADQRFRDGLSHGWAKFIDLRAALAPADADAAS